MNHPWNSGHYDLRSVMRTAVSLHQSGFVEFAADLYCEVLRVQPEHPGALHLLGVSMRAYGHTRDAIDLLRKSVSLDANNAVVHFNLGNALQAAAQLPDALESFDAALRLQPGFSAAHHNRGDILRELKRFEESVKSYDAALKIEPSLATAWMHKAEISGQLLRYGEALECYRRAILAKRDFTEAYCNRGILLLQLKKYRNAYLDFQRALKIDDSCVEAHFYAGNALIKMARFEEAIAAFNRATSLRPQMAEAFDNKGCALERQGKWHAALESHEAALNINPLAEVAHNNRGNLLRKIGRERDALDSFDRALALNPTLCEAWNNRGIVLNDLRRHDEALHSFHRALELSPGNADVYFHIAIHHLSNGDFKQGWREYEWRWGREKTRQAKPSFAPQWTGAESLEGKNILLYGEQGLGDCLQFARYVKMVVALGATAYLNVPASLAGLMKAQGFALCALNSSLHEVKFDYLCSLMSLPLAMGTELDSIPAAIPYLRSEELLCRKWAQRLGTRRKMRIGFVWSGNPGHDNDFNRSIDLADFVDLTSEQYECICLQKEIREIDRPILAQHPGIAVFSDDLLDFSETAGLASNLDLVVTVDTSVAHLAGAMGLRTWILLPYNAEWRWLRERNDTPWYPTARLYRQLTPGSWREVIGTVQRDLVRLSEEIAWPGLHPIKHLAENSAGRHENQSTM